MSFLKKSFRSILSAMAILFVFFSVTYTSICLLWYFKLLIQDRFMQRTIKSGFVRHPFLTGDHIPNQQILEKMPDGSTYHWALNAQGCRDDVDYIETKKPDVTRWMCLGGSVLACGSKNEVTIPAFLQKNLNQNFPSKLEVYNFGRVGWDSTQVLIAFATEFRKYRPDYLLLYSGRNDAFQASMPVYRPFWNSWSFETDRELNQRSYSKELFYPLWRASEKIRTLRSPTSYAKNNAHQLFQEKNKGIFDFYRAHHEIGPIYRDNLLNIIALAQNMGCKGVYLVLQPQLEWCNKNKTQEEMDFEERRLQPSWSKAMKELYPVIKEAHAQVAQSSVLPLLEIDLNPWIAQSSSRMFMDDCHLTDSGNEAVSHKIAPEMQRLMEKTRQPLNSSKNSKSK